MNEKPQGVSGWTDRVNVSSLPFIAGVVLILSGVLSFVLGLYTFNRWWGWCFIALGILLAIAGVALARATAWARVAGAILALVSLGFTAAWASLYIWFTIPVIAFDVLALYAIATHTITSRVAD